MSYFQSALHNHNLKIRVKDIFMFTISRVWNLWFIFPLALVLLLSSCHQKVIKWHFSVQNDKSFCSQSSFWMKNGVIWCGWKWAGLAVLFSRQLPNGFQDFFQTFSIYFLNYFIKYPQTTIALPFLTHIILGGVFLVTSWEPEKKETFFQYRLWIP